MHTVDLNKLLVDLENSIPGSVDERVIIDIVMNIPEYQGDINFRRAFNGGFIREDVLELLGNVVIDQNKTELRKSLRETIPRFLKQIKDALNKLKI